VSVTPLSPSRLRPADSIGLARLGLSARPARTALTATGIALGIAAMVAVIGISASSRAGLLAELDALGTNLLEVRPGQSFVGSSTELPAAAPEMIARISPVIDVAAVSTVDATVRRTRYIPEAETGGITVLAADPALLGPLEGSLAAGTSLDTTTERLPAAVLGAVAAQRLGIGSLAGLPTVHVSGHDLAVIGVLREVPLAPNLDRSILIGRTIAATLYGASDNPSVIYLRTVPSQIDAVRDVIPTTANPEAPNEVNVSRPSDALAARAAANTAFTALLLGLGAVALLVGGVGIANVMVISVLERRAEIGVRRALGATRRHIAVQFVAEASLLAGLGGLVGVALGAVVTVGYAATQGWLVSVPAAGLAGGVLTALALGALAGLYPARRAARLDPADAVRPAG